MKEENREKDMKRGYGVKGVVFDAVSVIVSSITLLAIAFSFCVRMVGVKGESMENTLFDGDWLLVTPYYTEPERGDIVICTKDTAAQGAIVKRVVALGGDEVLITYDDQVYVNGELQNEPYAQTGSHYGTRGLTGAPFTVPEGCVFLMGDNRGNSMDSRFVGVGDIETGHLLGKVQMRVGPNSDVYYNLPDED